MIPHPPPTCPPPRRAPIARLFQGSARKPGPAPLRRSGCLARERAGLPRAEEPRGSRGTRLPKLEWRSVQKGQRVEPFRAEREEWKASPPRGESTRKKARRLPSPCIHQGRLPRPGGELGLAPNEKAALKGASSAASSDGSSPAQGERGQ